jgi:hypothetical protein
MSVIDTKMENVIDISSVNIDSMDTLSENMNSMDISSVNIEFKTIASPIFLSSKQNFTNMKKIKSENMIIRKSQYKTISAFTFLAISSNKAQSIIDKFNKFAENLQDKQNVYIETLQLQLVDAQLLLNKIALKRKICSNIMEKYREIVVNKRKYYFPANRTLSHFKDHIWEALQNPKIISFIEKCAEKSHYIAFTLNHDGISIPGGKGEMDENAEQAALREIKEEIYDLDDIQIDFTKLHKNVCNTRNGIRKCYFFGGIIE